MEVKVMSSLSVRFLCLAAAFLVVMTGGIAFLKLLADDGSDLEVEAAMSPNKDAGGYMWVDSLEPEPIVEFDWIDAAGNPNSVYLENVKYYYTTKVYQKYDLPFSFPFYDDYYDSCYVVCGGYIDFGGWQYSPPGYYYLSSSTVPQAGYENGWIAAWGYAIGGYQSYPTHNFKVFALEGQTYGEKWVCFEWFKALAPGSYGGQPNPSQYEITFEIIIYESGLIKMQYLDADTAYAPYSNGGYATAGIEDVTGTKGIAYTKYSDTNIKSGLAVMYGKEISKIRQISMNTEEGGALFAEYRDYTLTAEVRHPINSDMIRVVGATLGNGFADMVFFQNKDGTYFFTENDPNNFIELDPKASKAEVKSGYLVVTFVFTPTFSYPVTVFQDLKVTVLGAGAMPASATIDDLFWVENRLHMVGFLAAYSEEVGYIENGGWVKGSEQFYFRGIKAVYPGTTFSPLPGTYSFTVTDEVGNKFVQSYVEGYANIPVTAENDLVKKMYILNITDVPSGTDVSDPVVFYLNIDPYRPTPPKEVLIHADSFDDRNTEYDDDNEVFVTWEPAEDFESGIAGYYVATFDPFLDEGDGQAAFVESPDTSAKITFDDMGTRKVWVWSMDKAGNPSVPSYALTKIDATEVTFSEFSPGNQVWVNTHTPVCSVLVDDTGGSGVSAKDLQYQVSQTNTLEYGAWQSTPGGRNAEQIRLSVKALFANGKNNYIRFRAKDVAGNGWTYSKDYNVWVDEERPSFVNFRPYEVEYQNGVDVVVSVDVTDIHSSREGSGIRLDTVEYRVSTQGRALFGDWVSAPISSVNDRGVVHVEMELTFREGTENYIQFRCYDDVGNFATSKEFNIKVNSVPDVHAFMGEPSNGHTYTTSEKILFDASKTSDPDGDDLDFMWYSDINGFLSGSDSFFRSLSPGVHEITLVVNDPAHSVVRTFEIEVLEEMQIDPAEIDTDGDGIYDEWEIRYGLDPNRPDSFIDADKDKFTNLQEFQNGTDPVRSVSHPPYPDYVELKDPTAVDDREEQYRSVTLALVLVSVLVMLVLILLAYSKYRSFALERDEERELERDEAEYREVLEKRKKA